MGLKEVVQKNREFNLWKEGLEKEIQIKKESLTELNKTEFTLEDFKNYSYEEAKEVYEVMQYNLDYNTQRKEVAAALQEIKEDTYAILKVAHYYPVINQLDYLTDKQKNDLDSYLSKVRNGYIYTSSTAWYHLKLSREIGEKVLQDLHKKGVFQKCHQLLCDNCSSWVRVLTEEEFENHRKYFTIVDKYRKTESVTQEEEDWFEDFDSNGRIWEITCLSCEDGYFELERFSQLEEGSQVVYKNITEPDFTYSKK